MRGITPIRIGRWRPHRRRLRQLAVAAAAAIAVYAVLGVLAPAPPPTVAVVVAAHDLLAGARPTGADVRIAAYPTRLAPAGAWHAAQAVPDRALAVSVGSGEPLSASQFVGPAMLVDRAGEGALPLRFDDAAAVALLRPGDRIDIWAATTATVAADAVGTGTSTGAAADPGTARLVVSRVPVLAVPGADASTGTGSGGIGSLATAGSAGGVVVLGCDRAQAAALAQASAGQHLTPVIVPP